jgi:hypothetical protein
MKPTKWSEFLGSVTIFTHNLVLVWDWKKEERPLDREEYKSTSETTAAPGTKLKYEPDASFWHDDAEQPGAIEVAYRG